MTKIEELKATYEAATPGEWGTISASSGKHPAVCCLADDGNDTRSICEVDTLENAKFIALAHNMMPQLLQALDLLRVAISIIEDEFPIEDDAYAAVARCKQLTKKMEELG